MDKRHLQMVFSFLLVSAVTACGGGGGAGSIPAITNATNATNVGISTNPQASHAASVAVNTTPVHIQMDAGSTVAVGGWQADADNASVGDAGTWSTSNAIDTTHVSSPAPQAIYQTQRYATHLTYTVPNLLPSHPYLVRLHLAESYFGAAKQRIFNVTLNGAQVLTNLDIFSAAGGANIAIVKQFNVTSDTTGKIKLQLDASVNDASLNGLEIVDTVAAPTPAPTTVPTAAPVSNVIAIHAGGASSGKWIADADYQFSGWNGVYAVTNAINTANVASPAPQAIYQSQRWAANLAYIVPNLTPNAAYTLRLHFAETYWTAAGQRVFNISINGVPAITGFDVFKAAGGQNIAVVKAFSVHADASGKLTVSMVSTADNASIAGVEILSGGAIVTPTPSPSATPSPTPSPTSTPVAGKYPLYSAMFKGSSPFHATVSYLTSLSGTQQLSSTTVSNFWNQSWYNIVPAQNTPVFSASPHNYSYSVSCLLYSSSGCNAQGKKAWFNTNSLFTEADADHHIVSVDPISGYEIDGWGGDPSYACTTGGGTLNCSWGGIFYYNSGGLDTSPGDAGDHAGFAIGAFILSAQDMLNGLNGTPIKHALGTRARCLDNLPTGHAAYPADTALQTDASCTGNNDGGPGGSQPAYGDLFVLNMTASQIASSSYSPSCKVVLNALATYGAYLMDTGGGNNGIWVENPQVYGSSNNPWYNTIEPAFSGDGNNSPGTNFSYQSCMNRLSAGNFKMYEIQSGAGQ